MTSTSGAIMPCPPPWLAFGNHCYLYVIKEMLFLEAEEYCSNFSKPGQAAHLVSISDQAENGFIGQYAERISSKRFWIGFNDMQQEGNFVWMDGSLGNFSNWDDGEPNNSKNQQHCTNVYADRVNYTWDDRQCYRSHRFVCKMLTVQSHLRDK